MQYSLKKLVPPESNAAEIVQEFIGLLGVRISRTTLVSELQGHTNYPSLLSISDMLKNFGISNVTVRLAENKWSALEPPFLAHLKEQHNTTAFYTIIREIDEQAVTFFHPEKHAWQTENRQTFVNRTSGVLLLAEADEQAGEAGYHQKTVLEQRERRMNILTATALPAVFTAAVAASLASLGAGALLPVLFAMITMLGSLICCLLIWHDIDQYNPVARRVCSSNKKTSCTKVLQSAGAKIFGVSWSIIGFTYFSGSLVFLLVSGLARPGALAVLSWLNALALPFIGYSLYYQGRTIKKWCTLCLLVQGCLVLQAVTTLPGGWHSGLTGAVITASIVPLVTCFALCFVSSTLLLRAMRAAQEGRKSKIAMQRLKNNPKIFEALLQRQTPIGQGTQGLGITLGNQNAPHKIVKICSPYCEPCAEAHGPIEQLLQHRDDLQLQIIFTATDHDTDKRALPASHLLSIAEQQDQLLTMQALSDWYSAKKKDYTAFASKYPGKNNLQAQRPQLAAMSAWCQKAGIVATPTIFVNGYQLPEPYNVNDLKYFL